ncbi:MAG: hypothetical protein EBX52_10590, partial [Proteobacteria bacterium]|nr:hypothetical protein [Pseudomonadota bacterium]
PENKIEVPELFLMGPTHDLLLTWKSSPICVKFEVNASKSADFSSTILKAETEKNFHSLKSPEPGTYYWRVACVYRDDFRLFSKARSFTIREPAQPLKAGN